MTTITQDMIDTWRTNYGLDTNSPKDAMRYWHDRCAGMAPAGAVAALGLALNEVDELRGTLADLSTKTRALCLRAPGWWDETIAADEAARRAA